MIERENLNEGKFMMDLRTRCGEAFFQAGRQLRKGMIGVFLIAFSSCLEAATFTVTTVADDGSAGTLRSAINSCNQATGPHTIAFALPGKGPFLLQPLTPLPQITQSVLVDGYSQPGAKFNTQPFGSYDGVILIEINGNNYTTGDMHTGIGLDFFTGSDGSVVRGLALTQWMSTSMRIQSHQVLVGGNFFGISLTDLSPAIATGANAASISIFSPAENLDTGIVIGGPNYGDRNVFVGGFAPFIPNAVIYAERVRNVNIINNMFGTNPQGTASFASVTNNTANAIQFSNVFESTISGNIISGCTQNGIVLSSASLILIKGNLIGTDYSGKQAIPNLNAGIVLYDALQFGCANNQITENTIAGNGARTTPYLGGGNGIIVGNPGGYTAAVINNWIHHNQIGGVDVENTGNGIILADNSNKIENNTISGNEQSGLLISSNCISNQINGNIIGLSGDQSMAVPNKNGIQMGEGGGKNASLNNVIGPNNVIAGNSNVGIFITAYSAGNLIDQGNFFGITNLVPPANFPNLHGDIKILSSTQSLD